MHAVPLVCVPCGHPSGALRHIVARSCPVPGVRETADAPMQYVTVVRAAQGTRFSCDVHLRSWGSFNLCDCAGGARVTVVCAVRD